MSHATFAERPPLLDVRALQTLLPTTGGPLRAVDGVSLQIRPGERIGLVGESGCGKSMTARSILRLLPPKSGAETEGEVLLDGRDLVKADDRTLQSVRGGEISMVFQDPLSYLNPRMRIGEQVAEAVRLHDRQADVAQAVAASLSDVGLPDTQEFRRRYPHELSGGMRQRVLIAIALACKPRLLIADEPTTALDVTLQAQILELLERLCEERQLALLLITHDMGVVARLCHRVYVMYAGQIVESATTEALFADPRHPYTQALLNSTLRVDRWQPEFFSIPGTVPDLVHPPAGCRFQSRCARSTGQCASPPPLKPTATGVSRCWF